MVAVPHNTVVDTHNSLMSLVYARQYRVVVQNQTDIDSHIPIPPEEADPYPRLKVVRDARAAVPFDPTDQTDTVDTQRQ